MSEDMKSALILSVVRLFISMPMVIAGAMAFYSKKRVKRAVVIACLAAIALYLIASNIILRGFGRSDNYYLLDQISGIISNLLMMLFFALCYRLHLAQLVYVFCLLHAGSTLVNQISYMLAIALTPPGTKIAILTSPLYSLLMIGLTLICALLLYRFCKSMLLEAFETLETKSIWQMCIVPVIFFVIFQVTQTVMLQFNGEGSVIFLLILLFAAAVLSYVVNLQAVMGSAKTAGVRREAEETKKLMLMQERSYKQLLNNIEQTRQARHDLRFHLSVISDFAKKGDSDGLASYLESYSDRISVKEISYCENPAVDAVVRYYVQKAQSLGAACDCAVSLPAKTAVEDIDLCVIFGNLLENAVHSLESQSGSGFIKLRCATQERRILIAVDNSLPVDFKGFEKGIGISSVCTAASMYGGEARLEAIDGVFKASVILHTS